MKVRFMIFHYKIFGRGIILTYLIMLWEESLLNILLWAFRLERDDYDLNYKGLRIEIKSWAYIQSWEQRKFSNIIFWIKPTQAEKWGDKKRQSDLYIFCLLKHKQAWSIDPLKLEQRTFYTLPTSILDEKVEGQKTITLQSLLKLMPKENSFVDLKEHLDTFL